MRRVYFGAAALIMVVIGGLLVFFYVGAGGSYSGALSTYLKAAVKSDPSRMYALSCDETRQTTSLADFTSKFEEQVRPLGRIKSYSTLRGDETTAYAILHGERSNLMALIPMRRESGHWRPCATDPLGRLVQPYSNP